MTRADWLFLFAAISALNALGTLLRLGVSVIQWWRKDQQMHIHEPYTPREKVMLALICMSFILSALGFYLRETAIKLPLEEWGTHGRASYTLGQPGSLTGTRQSLLQVNGVLLRAWQEQQYKLIGIGFHHLRSGDVLDEPNISKSGLYDIEGRHIEITIPWNDQFINELIRGAKPTTYELLAVPAGVSPESFTTLRQAVALGAKRLQRVSGPP